MVSSSDDEDGEDVEEGLPREPRRRAELRAVKVRVQLRMGTTLKDCMSR